MQMRDIIDTKILKAQTRIIMAAERDKTVTSRTVSSFNRSYFNLGYFDRLYTLLR
jgi:hypothetical protein